MGNKSNQRVQGKPLKQISSRFNLSNLFSFRRNFFLEFWLKGHLTLYLFEIISSEPQ